eukprot:gene3262-3743_t
MSRSIGWRRVCPDDVKTRIDEALVARLYILRETGPTGFLVKQDGSDAKLKVFLGDPNSCTCGTFSKEKELCIHILWVMLRKFRVSKDNPLIFQKALVEREISELIQGVHVQIREERKAESSTVGESKLNPKTIEEEDVCPICQEDLIACKEPLTYCKFGCGNNVHIKCMKVWAQHRKSDGENIIKCPLCRTDFGSYQDVIQEFHSLTTKRRSKIETNDLHLGATCQHCKASPIQGKCYRCVLCIDYHLCHACFKDKHHSHHSFQFRKNTNQRWRPASRTDNKSLPDGIINNLQNREITNDDYDLLFNLDRPSGSDYPSSSGRAENLSIEVLRGNADVIKQRESCQMCMQLFTVSQCVRRLACNHTFHRECIGNWIYHGNTTCPLDGELLQTKPRLKSSKGDQSMKSGNTADLNRANLAILGINSSMQKLMVRPPNHLAKIKRKSIKSHSSNELSGMSNDVIQLSINGMQTRPNNNTIEHDLILGPPVTSPGPVSRGKTWNSRENTRPQRGLPPIHPGRSQTRGRSGNKDTATRLHGNDGHLNGSTFANLSLMIGENLESERRMHSIKRKPITNIRSTAVNKLSSSEPNLLALSDVLRVSGHRSRSSDLDTNI